MDLPTPSRCPEWMTRATTSGIITIGCLCSRYLYGGPDFISRCDVSTPFCLFHRFFLKFSCSIVDFYSLISTVHIMARPKRSSGPTTFQKEDESEGSGEESEWEQTTEGQGVEESDDAGDDNDDDAVEETKPDNTKSSEVNTIVKRAPWNKGLGKKRKRPHEYDTDNEDGEDCLPTIVRKTDKGGYAHTKKSRARIGKANKGKCPWNKGKHRSEEVKAKIRAGVVARNQAILAVKLKKLGMTEGEWITKKKEIKYLRERVRRAKLAVNKKKEEMTQENLLKLERELKDALDLKSTIDNNVSILDQISVFTCQMKMFVANSTLIIDCRGH